MRRKRAFRRGLAMTAVLLALGGGILYQMRAAARNSQRAFVSWARHAAIPMPASPEEPMSEQARLALGRMLEGKRFVFLGEPDHFINEKFPYRLTFIQHLFEQGWQNVGLELGRSLGWRVDRYIETGDAAYLAFPQVGDGFDYRKAFGRVVDFIEQRQPLFFEQLHQMSESRPAGQPRLRFFGFDIDAAAPLATVEPIEALLREHARDENIRRLLDELDALEPLETDQRLKRITAMQEDLAAQRDVFVASVGDDHCQQLESWLRTLRADVAAADRPRQTQDPSGHRLWRAERERTMMTHLDDIVDALAPGDKVILMAHNGHLSKNASNLYFRPQRSVFWGYCSWLRAQGYGIDEKVTRRPLDMYGGSIGNHVHDRFSEEVLSIWMLYGQGQLMGRDGPKSIRLHTDTIESLLAQVGDRFLLPLDQVDPQAREVLTRANTRSAGGYYASTDLTIQADALYFVKTVTAEAHGQAAR